MVRTTWTIRDKEEPFIRMLGIITSRYILLEELITGCINMLVGGEYASIFTSGMTFSNCLTILEAVYRQKFKLSRCKDYSHIFTELLIQARKAGDERNKIMHSIWQSTHINNTLMRTKRNVKQKKGLVITREFVSIQDLSIVAEDIQNAVETALNFTYDILFKYMPILVSPGDGAVLNTTPNFNWLPVEGAVSYELSISEKPDFTELIILKSGGNTIKSTTYTCEIVLQKDRTYYWKVQPIIATEEGYPSETRSFTVQ